MHTKYFPLIYIFFFFLILILYFSCVLDFKEPYCTSMVNLQEAKQKKKRNSLVWQCHVQKGGTKWNNNLTHKETTTEIRVSVFFFLSQKQQKSSLSLSFLTLESSTQHNTHIHLIYKPKQPQTLNFSLIPLLILVFIYSISPTTPSTTNVRL